MIKINNVQRVNKSA